jgi:hypothetical protein
MSSLYAEGVKPVSREREAAESDFSSGITATGMERLWNVMKKGLLAGDTLR